MRETSDGTPTHRGGSVFIFRNGSLLHFRSQELLEGGAFRDVTEAQIETFQYIERYYNPVRRHSALGYVSPEEFEQAFYQGAKTPSLTAKKPERKERKLREFGVH